MVEHEQSNSWAGEAMDWNVEGVLTLEINWDVSWTFDQEISAVVNISESVSSNDNGFGPVFNQPWHVFDHNWLSEDSTI